MGLFWQTVLVLLVFGVLLFLNVAIAPRAREAGAVPVTIRLLPLFALANGAWFAYDVWTNRVADAMVPRVLWSAGGLVLATGGFLWLAAWFGNFITGRVRSRRAPDIKAR